MIGKRIYIFLVQIVAALSLFACASTPGREKPLGPVMAVAISQDNSMMAVTTDEHEVALFDISPLRFRSLLTAEDVKIKPKLDALFRSPPLAFSQDGRLLIVAGVGGQIVGWDATSGAQRFRSPIDNSVVDLVVLPDNSAFITVGHGVSIWATDTGNLIGVLELPHGVTATSVCTSIDGQAILVGLSNGDIAVYNSANRKLIRTFKVHQVAVTGLAFAPDGKSFASSAGLYDPRIWKIDENLQLSNVPTSNDLASTAAKAGSGTQAVKLLAWLLGAARGFQLVGAPTLGAPPASSPAARKTSPFCGPRVAFSPDGRYLASTAHLSLISGEFQLFLTDLKSNQTRTITGVYGCSVAFTRDSKMVITGGMGAPVLWSTETGERLTAP